MTAKPEPWHCPDCGLTYTSPLPLRHPPAHSCQPPGRTRRIRNMTPGEPIAVEVNR